jgi:nucleoid-associated protein YgaU
MPDPAFALVATSISGDPSAVEMGALALTASMLAALAVRSGATAGWALATSLIAAIGRTAAALRPRVVVRLVGALIGFGVGATASPTPAQASITTLVPPDRPAPRPGVPPSPAPVVAAATGTYLVRPGDTLWDIARRHLGPRAHAADVARAWPRWYAANRDQLGPDPSVIRPGTRLRVPGDRATPSAVPAPRHGTGGAEALARALDPDRR